MLGKNGTALTKLTEHWLRTSRTSKVEMIEPVIGFALAQLAKS